MDTFQSMRLFMKVVEAGSFTAAAQQLNTTTAQTSRAVSDLEAHLQTRLLNRTTRRLAMTEGGERYFQRCERILAYIEEAEAEAGNAHAPPSGRLKVHSITSFGQDYVVPLVARYRELYPTVQIELTLTQRMPNLLDEGYDVALLQARELPDPGLISQRLGSVCSIACASPGYIERYGQPHTLSDLSRHACLRLAAPGNTPGVWRFDGPNGEEVIQPGSAAFIVNVPEAMVMAMAIREGMGIGVLPISSALPHLRTGTLVRVFPDYTLQDLQIFALYPSRRYLDAKIRTWVEFLREELPNTFEHDRLSLRRHC